MLNPSLVQFTVLGIVFKNDYSRNIPSLGSATNYKVIKELDGEDYCSSKVGGETDADDYDGQEKAEKEQEKDVGDLERKDSDHLQFHTVLLHNLHIYDSIVTTNAVGKHVQQFVDRAADFMLLQRRNDRGAIVARKPYPATDLLRSVASQLLTEVKKQYRNGSIELEKKPKTLNAKGLVSDGVCTEIDQDIPAIENIVLLNQSSKSYRKTALLTSMEQPFISLSEREFGKLQELVLVDFEDKSIIPSKSDPSKWLQGKTPRFLITEMLSNIGRNEARKGPRDYKDSTSVMDLSMMREHVQFIRQADFDPTTYKGRGYVHRSSLFGQTGFVFSC
ncbi:hypothetical protein BGZ54_003357 [Gamsiella multidivaricata]|nr:hypothetical protein BGZ54_003357 [Gamsiella multidivaricata]